jgi:hypothetical protein
MRLWKEKGSLLFTPLPYGGEAFHNLFSSPSYVYWPWMWRRGKKKKLPSYSPPAVGREKGASNLLPLP